MIKYYEGTVFNVGAQAIVNTINCEGAMGAGLALEFMLRYPEMYDDYKKKCDEGKLKPGYVDYFKYNENEIVINFPTKWLFKYPSRIQWIEDGLKDFANTYKEQGIKSVAFPKLGASNGGLNWEEVKVVMEKYLNEIEADVFICLDNMKEAAGIEKSMLELFNRMSIEQLSNVTRLSNKQKEIIEKEKPYKRFWHIQKTKGIGATTYNKLFSYCYSHYDSDIGNEPEQISMF